MPATRRRRFDRAGRPGIPIYPPRQLPPHPQLVAARRRRIPVLALVLVGIVVLVGAIIIAVTTRGSSTKYANAPYAPQISRNFESVGNPDGPLSKQSIDDIARNNAYEFMPKFADHYNLQQHFADTRAIVAAAHSYGNNIKVFDYFNGSYWFTANETGWGSYAEGFQQSWLLRDSTGQAIPFVGNANANGSGPPKVLGYVMDLSNPSFRAWAVSTIVSWMKAAPYRGINFDSTAPMQGAGTSRYISDGTMTYNGLLCGAAFAAATTNCNRVQQWNNGQIELLTATQNALAQLGDQVRYNGIAPSPLRGETRNVGLLRYTNIASNEGFCMAVSVANPDNVTFNSIVDDAHLMQQIAAEHKMVTETTNIYQSSAKQKYGQYCVAGFLIGWQPGSSYYCFHDGYSYPPGDKYPLVPEQNLNLGQPLTTDYQTQGSALTRRFQNGFVAVNPTDTATTITVPEPVVAFANGSAGQKYAAGATVTLPGRGALLSLTQLYAFGRTGR